MQFKFLPLPAAGEASNQLRQYRHYFQGAWIPGREYNALSSAPHISGYILPS